MINKKNTIGYLGDIPQKMRCMRMSDETKCICDDEEEE